MVNLPTVPGDVMVGAASVVGCVRLADFGSVALQVVAACLASVLVYMFGLADNDILGSGTDVGRPIPDGQISLGAAKMARGMCLFVALVIGAVANLPPFWWIASLALVVTIIVYNRTKWCVAMGLCRGLDVIVGAAAVMDAVGGHPWLAAVVAMVWTVYIAAVTKYSEGEEMDVARKARVGLLIGAIVYLQLVVLITFGVRPLIIAGAVMMVMLRFSRKLLPEVSAS